MQWFVSKRLRGIVKNQLLWCPHIVWWNWFFLSQINFFLYHTAIGHFYTKHSLWLDLFIIWPWP